MPDNLQPRNRPIPISFRRGFFRIRRQQQKSLTSRAFADDGLFSGPFHSICWQSGCFSPIGGRLTRSCSLYGRVGGVCSGYGAAALPLCKKQFYVKHVLMNLRARRCVHCGFDSHSVAEAVGRDGVTQ